MSFRGPHLLGLAGLEAHEIGDLLDQAETWWEAAGTPGWRAERTPAIGRRPPGESEIHGPLSPTIW